ncbi:MAG: LEA type 2 family protein, partial [Bacteroidota bacterium]
MEQTDLEWRKISLSAYELSSVIHLQNPNLLSSTIKTIDERFFINGKQIGELSNAIGQGIPGRKETTFPVKVRIPKDEIPSFYLDSIRVPQPIEINIKGEIVFENLFGGGKVLIDQKNTVYVTEL